MILIFANKNAKMRFIGVLILALLLGPTSTAQTRRALVIGIGHYQDSEWPLLHGDNDVKLVKQMLSENGFEFRNIKTLINEQARYQNIKDTINELINKSQKGDIVYFHFSGHGQQITDLDGDEPDITTDTDYYDEALVAYDTPISASHAAENYRGERHVIDDSLYIWFSKITNKIGEKGKLIVVVDACFSGGTLRGEKSNKFDIKYADPGKILKINGEKGIVKPIKWIHIAACKDTETAQEIENNGLLSFAIYKLSPTLKNTDIKNIETQLQNFVSKEIKRIDANDQTPTIKNPTGFTTLF